MWANVVVALQLFTLATADNHTEGMDCYSHGMDVGGSTNACGYMDEVAVIAASGVAKPGWYDGFFLTLPANDIDSPEKCQALCEERPECDWFAYGTYCVLKRDYHNASCTPVMEPNTDVISGPSNCESCTKLHNDVGGGFNSCGYMDNVLIYAKAGVSKQSWYNGLYVVLEDIQTWTAEECKHYCHDNPDCDYFHVSEEHCYLKHDYSPEQYANSSLGGCLPLYAPFDVIRPFEYASGPGTCVDVSHSVSCGALKHAFRQGTCCGRSSQKMVPMP